MDLPLPRPDDPLAQPTRARLFALLVALRRPATTDELAERLGRHPNGVRVHLDRLLSAGLLVRTRVPASRGQPRDRWSVHPDAEPGGHPPRAYGDLGRWLARAVPSRPDRLDEVEAAGRAIGREIAPAPGAGGVVSAGAGAEPPLAELLQSALAALGFRPRRERGDPERVCFALGNCPYRDAVHDNQPVVCSLHTGITEGLLDALDPAARLLRFVPHDPDEAGCLVDVGAAGGSSR